MDIIARLETGDGRIMVVTNVPAKEFKTGSKGFHIQRPVVFNGKRYFMNILIVEQASKKGTTKDENKS
jgi:hypothetical protein